MTSSRKPPSVVTAGGQFAIDESEQMERLQAHHHRRGRQLDASRAQAHPEVSRGGPRGGYRVERHLLDFC